MLSVITNTDRYFKSYICDVSFSLYSNYYWQKINPKFLYAYVAEITLLGFRKENQKFNYLGNLSYWIIWHKCRKTYVIVVCGQFFILQTSCFSHTCICASTICTWNIRSIWFIFLKWHQFFLQTLHYVLLWINLGLSHFRFTENCVLAKCCFSNWKGRDLICLRSAQKLLLEFAISVTAQMKIALLRALPVHWVGGSTLAIGT